jgi:hypothetical protein
VRIDPTPFLRAVLDRQLLEGPHTSSFLEGNLDRRSELARTHLRVTDARGRTVKLTLGRELAPLRERADQIHAAIPRNSPATVFFFTTADGEIWAQEWIEGPSLEAAFESADAATAALLALEDLNATLAATAEISSSAEWDQALATQLQNFSALPIWTEPEKNSLQQTVFPALRSALRPREITRRWSNGDFTSSNLKLCDGRLVLLDSEHGEKTFFSFEDQVRFRRLSPVALRHPGLFGALWPAATPGGEIFFQLRQLSLEVAANTPEYLSRVIPERKAHLRFVGESAGLDLSAWSVIAQPPPPVFAKETVQLFWQTDTDAAWNENNSTRLEIRRGARQWFAFPMPAGIRQLRLDPTAAPRCVVVHALRLVTTDGGSYDCLPEITAEGADLQRRAAGIEVHPHAADPQLLLPLKAAVRWLVGEIEVSETPANATVAVTILHHIENARWLADGSSAIEISGWCFSPQTGVTIVEAYSGNQKIAEASTVERPDVQRHHGGNASALRSGFTLGLPLLELETTIELRAVTETSAGNPFFRVRAGELPHRGPVILDYPAWASAQKSAETPLRPTGPLISILLPIFNTPPRFLSECIESVRAQIYPHWELRIVDDGSTQPELPALLARFARRDERIRVERLPKNGGISRATNHALAAVQGEFIACLDHDDRLHPQALAEVVQRLLATAADAVYTDEEKITEDGAPCLGIFKPDFSPEFFRGVMYVGHFLCARTSVARTIGGFDPRFDGVQDFEFALRLSEHTSAIEHIPRVLYQWRMSPSSSAQAGNVKGDMDQRQLAAVTAHLARIGRAAVVTSLGAHRLRLLPVPNENSSPVIIARTAASAEKIRQTFATGEIKILASPSPAELRRLLASLESERLVWVNEPVALTSPFDLSALAGFLDDPSVAAAAPVLLANDGKIFAAGAILTSAGKIVPAMRGFAREGDGYNGSLRCNREVSTVLAACVALRKKDLLEHLNETAHPFTDSGMAELCQALRRRGARILACGGLQFGTERSWADQGTVGQVAASWPDPYYNPQFDETKGDYRLRTPRLAK